MNQFTHTDIPDTLGHWDTDARASLRTQGRICYCLFDFDLSLLFPPDKSFRLSTIKGRGSPWLHPSSLYAENIDLESDPELDPFKFDVACMGNMLTGSYDVRHLSILLHIQMANLDTYVTARNSSFPFARTAPGPNDNKRCHISLHRLRPFVLLPIHPK
jgi:hypothetical protein